MKPSMKHDKESAEKLVPSDTTNKRRKILSQRIKLKKVINKDNAIARSTGVK